MQNEILKPVLETDDLAVPRYDVVTPNGAVAFENVELRLKNEIVQEGTPYSEEAVMPTELREKLELGKEATPGQALLEMLNRGGGAVRRNRPPVSTDAETVGKLWMVPTMTFNNLMPNALAQSASDWGVTSATASVATDAVTVTGDGSNALFVATATMSKSVAVNHKVYVRSVLTAVHDANEILFEVVHNGVVSATYTWQFPIAGATYDFSEVVTTTENGQLQLRVTAKYSTAAVQSGKSVTVSAITVFDMTTDMCEAQEGNEFTASEAHNYLDTYGNFQSRVYEFSSQFWLLVSVTDDVFDWANISSIVPSIGTVQQSVQAPIGNTWLECDGAILDTSLYPELDSALNHTLAGDYELSTMLAKTFKQPSGNNTYSYGQLVPNYAVVHDNYLYWGTSSNKNSPYRALLHRMNMDTQQIETFTIYTGTESNYPLSEVDLVILHDRIFAFFNVYYSSNTNYKLFRTASLSNLSSWSAVNFGNSSINTTTNSSYYAYSDTFWYHDGYYVVGVASGSSRYFAYSTNGTSWTWVSASIGTSYSPIAAFVHDSKIHVITTGGSSSSYNYMYRWVSSTLSASATWSSYQMFGIGYNSTMMGSSVTFDGDTAYALRAYSDNSVVNLAVVKFDAYATAQQADLAQTRVLLPESINLNSMMLLNRNNLDDARLILARSYEGAVLFKIDPRKSTRVAPQDIATFVDYQSAGATSSNVEYFIVCAVGTEFASSDNLLRIIHKPKTLPYIAEESTVKSWIRAK